MLKKSTKMTCMTLLVWNLRTSVPNQEGASRWATIVHPDWESVHVVENSFLLHCMYLLSFSSRIERNLQLDEHTFTKGRTKIIYHKIKSEKLETLHLWWGTKQVWNEILLLMWQSIEQRSTIKITKLLSRDQL